MILEPLKDKKLCLQCGCILRQCKTALVSCCPDCEHYKSNMSLTFDGVDIALAVEWLKKRLNQEHKGNGFIVNKRLIPINQIIDEAFEDVIK